MTADASTSLIAAFSPGAPGTLPAFALEVFLLSIAAGLLGSLLGVGGGLIVVPTLTLLLHLDIRFATGATLISVIATSNGAAARNARGQMTNLRLAMFLGVGSTSGALAGAYLAGVVPPRWLYVIFALVMAGSALAMFRARRRPADAAPLSDAIADRLQLHAAYVDQSLQREVPYRVSRTRVGFALMGLAGVMSGLLGIGSGVLKVPAMDLAMRLPMKVTSATTNFMIGVTATASAGVYFARGQINPFVAGPVAAGVLIGANGGARLLGVLHGSVIRLIFVAVLLWLAVEMLLKGIG